MHVYRSSIIWETVKRWNRWKPVSNEISAKLEQLYLVRTADKQSGGGPVEVSDSGWKVHMYYYIDYMHAHANAVCGDGIYLIIIIIVRYEGLFFWRCVYRVL